MKRALLAMTAVLGTAVAVALSCASPLQEIPEQKVEAADLPRTWGDRWYSIRRSGVRMAWLHLKVAEKEGKLAFEDEFALRKNASNEGRLEIRQTVEPNEFLSPISISLSARSSETRDRAFAMEVRDGRIRVLENTFSGDKGEADRPADFTTDPALYRLVTLLPRDAKRTVALLRTPFIAQPQLQARCILSYEEEETLRFEGKRFRTRRFVESDGDTETKRYWVDGAGRLLKVRFSPEVEMVLSDEKTAKDLETATIQREPWPSRVYDPRPLMKALPRKPPENALRFLVFGDSKGSDDFERVVRFADTLKPDFVL
ncbi:MAG TPA: hypothetical protein VI643_01790, partial [Planctomycetota bacterium]|nr:hypothetical protein [Planctomycetota bacterium]